MKENNPMCLAPWIGLYVSPHGLAPCCHIAPSDDLTMSDYQNSEFLTELRRCHSERDLDAVDWRCKVCMKKKYTLYGEMGYGADPVITQQWNEGKRDFMHVNIAISSKCSMSCKMCLISDKRFVELREHGTEVLGLGDKTLDYIVSDFDIVRLAKENKDTLRYVSFFGGDPAMHDTTHQTLDVLDSKTRIRYSCNGKLDRLTNGVGLVESLERFDLSSLSFSIDAVGELGKYIRKGIDYKRFDELYETFAADSEKYWVGISYTVSLWNIMRLAEEYDAIYDKYLHHHPHIIAFVTPVLEPSYAAIQNLPFSLRKTLRAKLRKYLDSLNAACALDVTVERKRDMFINIVEQIDAAFSSRSNKEGWERFKYLEQQHELKHGYNIKKFISEYIGAL